VAIQPDFRRFPPGIRFMVTRPGILTSSIHRLSSFGRGVDGLIKEEEKSVKASGA
jgi:hypothetical protein